MAGPIDSDPRMVAEFGRNGVVNTSDTSAVTGRFMVLQCTSDCVFTSITEEQATGAIALTWENKSLIWGDIRGYQLTSGSVRAYKA